jgi:hypothetical protein
MRPLHCLDNVTGDDFLRGSCHALSENQIAESEVFRDGMSLSD